MADADLASTPKAADGWGAVLFDCLTLCASAWLFSDREC